MYRSFTSSLLRSLNLQAAMYALISLTLVCNMQLNVLDDLAEAMKALDGKIGIASKLNFQLKVISSVVPPNLINFLGHCHTCSAVAAKVV